ncbi:MAG: MATE family efflux transporter, partial [Lachnospiraceae bacterium]|nr:MATE family efflux transporter [Lachnospiraceae bacterium]
MKAFDKKLIKETVNIAWPAVIESFFTAFVGLVDSYMVSGLGSNAVAAVGLTTQPKFMGLSMFFAINVSLSALVARRKGEQRKDDANRILVSGIFFILIAAMVISALLVLFASDIIRFCGSNSDTHDAATLYFKIVMGGMIFNCIQMGINSAQRGAGNTKITMRTNLTSNTVNIIFN